MIAGGRGGRAGGWVGLFEQGRSFLDALSPPDRKALLRAGSPRTYGTGETLTRERDRTSFVVVILGGWATVSVETERGARLILALRGEGSLVGDLAAVDARSRSATVTALGPLEAVVIAGDRFRGFLASSPAANALILRQLSARLRSSDGERRALASENVLQRLAARVVELVERAGAPERRGIAVGLPLPQHDLAAAIGATREAVAKALRLLREQNVLVTEVRRLVVIDLALLRLLAQGGGSASPGEAGGGGGGGGSGAAGGSSSAV